MGLNDQFTSTRGQILLMHPLPDITHAYSMLLQEENQRNFASKMSTTIPENVAMNVHINSASSKQSGKKTTYPGVIYDYCKRTGHTKDKCFVLHGYPDWHRLHGQPKPKLRHVSKANVTKAMVTENSPSSSHSSQTDLDSDELSDKQCQKLISMLQSKMKIYDDSSNQNASWIQANIVSQMAGSVFQTNAIVCINNASMPTSDDSWIIDSGATNHITYNFSLLVNVTPLQSDLHLPNGHTTCITHTGDIYLTNTIVLKHVLYVPTFKCNLISVTQFNVDNKCELFFTPTKCLMQDPVNIVSILLIFKRLSICLSPQFNTLQISLNSSILD